MTIEHKKLKRHYPNIEIKSVSNGFILFTNTDYRDGSVGVNSDKLVFETSEKLGQWIINNMITIEQTIKDEI